MPARRPTATAVLAALLVSLLPVASGIAHEPARPGQPSPHSADPWRPTPHARLTQAYRFAAPLNPELALAVLPPSRNVERVGGSNGFTGGHVVVEGDRLYVGAYGLGMRIFDLSADAENPTQIGAYVPGERADAVPDAAVLDGREIAILNGTRRVQNPFPSDVRTDRSEFLDVSDPANPRLLWTFVGQDDGEAHNGDIDDARRLWFPSGGSGNVAENATARFHHRGLRIYDLSPVLEEPPRAPERIVGLNPATLWEASPHRRGRPVGPAFSHTHDITLYSDFPVLQPDGSWANREILLLAEGDAYDDTAATVSGQYGGSTFVIDVTDPRDPVVLLRWLHDHTAPGHHPIRYHHEAMLLDGDRHVMLTTDEDLHNGCGSAGGITAVRLSDDLTDAAELSEWFIPADTPAAVCSVHVMSSWRSFVFLGSYNAGLQVVDYADPANPVQAGYYIAEGSTAWGALVHEGLVYVGDMSRGLDVFRFTPPLPDLSIESTDIALSAERERGADRVTITASVHNLGQAAASDVAVRFADDGRTIGGVQTIASIAPGASGSASVTWDVRGLNGEHTLTVTVDPAGAISETDESNNAASRTVTVRGNKIQNGDFEASSDGGSPDHWTSSGPTEYDGHSASAGAGGLWVSDQISVTPGMQLGFSVVSTGATGTAALEQLSGTGAVLSTVPLAAGETLTVADGVTHVRVALAGGLLGTTTFDDVRLWEE